MLWFPLLKKDSPGAAASQGFSQRLSGLGAKRRCTVFVTGKKEQPGEGRGLYGSALFIINPPWTLRAALLDGLAALASLLDHDGEFRWEETAGPQP
jgi:23S rRNA (adenine2030-N6)-methyltransferase